MATRARSLSRSGLGAVIGAATASGAAVPVLFRLDAVDLDSFLILAGPLVFTNTVVAAFAAHEGPRVVLAGAVGSAVFYLLIGLSIDVTTDALAVLAVPGTSIPATAVAWALAIGANRAVARRMQARIRRQQERRSLGLCAQCGYDCLGLDQCPECGHPVT